MFHKNKPAEPASRRSKSLKSNVGEKKKISQAVIIDDGSDEVVYPVNRRVAIQQFEINNGSPMVEIRREYAPELKSILTRLQAYVHRIDTDGMDRFKVCFFKSRRTANRQRNYNIAKNLIAGIENSATNLPLATTISKLMYPFAHSPTGIYMEMFTDIDVHTIRSRVLNRIIKDAIALCYNPEHRLAR